MGPYQNQDIAQQTADLLNGSTTGTIKQTGLQVVVAESVNFENKTKVVINVTQGTALITIFDTNGALLYSYDRTPNDSVLEFSNFGRQINKINVTCDTAADKCEVLTSDI